MRLARILIVLLITTGCSSEIEGEPLLGGEIGGDFDGGAFTAVYGFSRDITEPNLFDAVLQVFLGSAAISCADDFTGPPREGTYAVIYLTGNVAGSYPNTFVSFTRVSGGGDVNGGGSSTATVDLTVATAESIGGTVVYDDTIEGTHYGLDGDFEVRRCPE